MLMGQKYKVHRDVILQLVQGACGVNLRLMGSETEIHQATCVLDRIKLHGLEAGSGSQRNPAG